ncbi:hypothetical protein HDU98_008406 [Podochytrium sp. JEL0797]|nr:hypothetical protein HDU98_008406 [Podochytrium sp. JEL0797]
MDGRAFRRSTVPGAAITPHAPWDSYASNDTNTIRSKSGSRCNSFIEPLDEPDTASSSAAMSLKPLRNIPRAITPTAPTTTTTTTMRPDSSPNDVITDRLPLPHTTPRRFSAQEMEPADTFHYTHVDVIEQMDREREKAAREWKASAAAAALASQEDAAVKNAVVKPGARRKTFAATSSRRDRKEESLDPALIEHLEREREIQAKEWRVKKLAQQKAAVEEGTGGGGGDDGVLLGPLPKPSGRRKSSVSFSQRNQGSLDMGGGAGGGEGFMNFSDINQLKTVLDMTERRKPSSPVARREEEKKPTWKQKWEAAMLVNESALRFSLARHMHHEEDGKSAYGYRHFKVDPNSLFEEGKTKVDSWKFNGQVIEESINRTSIQNQSVRRRSSTASGALGSSPRRASSPGELIRPGINADDDELANYLGMAGRRRRSTMPKNINLIAGILKNTEIQNQKELSGMGQKNLGKCPFFSDPDLSNGEPISLWGALRKFQFPSEQDKRLLETVHKSHLTSVSNYPDLRKVLHWAPLNYHVFQHNTHRARLLDKTTWIPVPSVTDTPHHIASEDSFPPSSISAVHILQQQQEIRNQVERRAILGSQPPAVARVESCVVDDAVIPTLTRRIILTAIQKATAERNAQEVLFNNDGKHPSGVILLKEEKEEYTLLQNIKARHRQMAERRKIVKSMVSGVNDESVERELARWFASKNHFTFHVERFGLRTKPVFVTK